MFPSAVDPSFTFHNLKIFDVHLSFCGPEICQEFASRLDSALVAAGIFTLIEGKFKNDIHPFRRIRESRLCIPIFSKKFIQSKSFLNEVCHMVKSGVKIIPLFYNVLPTNLRRTQDFEQHLSNEIIKALKDVSETCGWSGDEYFMELDFCREIDLIKERILIEDVRREVVKILQSEKVHLDIPKCFGLNWRVEHVRRLLNVADRQKIMKVCIHGMGGMGKTTLAKVVYKKVFYSQFEVHCFVLSVGERCQQENGLVKLQTHMLNEVSHAHKKISHMLRS